MRIVPRVLYSYMLCNMKRAASVLLKHAYAEWDLQKLIIEAKCMLSYNVNLPWLSTCLAPLVIPVRLISSPIVVSPYRWYLIRDVIKAVNPKIL